MLRRARWEAPQAMKATQATARSILMAASAQATGIADYSAVCDSRL
jgi:hypothetical protein